MNRPSLTCAPHNRSRRAALPILLGILSALTTGTTRAEQVASRRALEFAATQGRNALSAFADRANIPGLQVAVGINGDIVWSEAFGYADLENRAPATPLTKFRIASISKALTGTLAARLVEQGKLDLDAPIQNYLSDYPSKQGTITSRMLAGHLSGIRHYNAGETMSAKFYPRLRDALDIFAEDDLLHAPGQRMSYTTYGYTVLGAVMESAADQDFETLLQTQLFDPLGMTNSGVDWHAEIIPNRSDVYVYGPGGTVRKAPLTDHSYKIPGGGILSTAEDLVRFGSAVLKPGLLKRETLDLLMTPMKTSDGRSTGYGLGWNISEDWYGRRVFGHGGNQPGSRSQLLVYPDVGVVVALIANMRSANFGDDECMAIADPFIEAAEGKEPASPTVDPLGRYELTSAEGDDTAVIEIWPQGPLLTGVAITPDDHIRLGSVTVSGSQIRCVFADTKMFMLKLDVSGDEVKGTLYRGSSTVPFTGTRKSPPLEQVADRAFDAQDWERAADAYGKLLTENPDEGVMHYRLGFALLMCNGGDSRAARAFQRAAELDYAKATSLYNAACAMARNRELDGAFEALSAALDAGFNRFDLIRTDGDLDNLRDDARFEALVKQYTSG